MFYFVVPASLKHVECANQIGLAVGVGIFNGIANAGLRTKMNYSVNLIVREEPLHGGSIGQIRLDESELLIGGVLADEVQASLLERGVVVGVQIVQTQHRVSSLKKAKGGEGTNESGSTGDKDMHSGLQIQDPTGSKSVQYRGLDGAAC